VYGSALQAIELLADELPRAYRADLAEAAARVGSGLYRIGAYDDAKRGFRLADRLGPPSFRRERRLYRLAARCFGPDFAERAGGMYRGLLPRRLRAFAAGRGW
jgi:hypothetical protein